MSATQMTLGLSTMRSLRRDEINALRQLANVASFTARKAWFRTRSRELGGYTVRTRDQIDSECEQKAREAAEAVYLTRGYQRCSDPWGFECVRLASPGYAECPFCDVRS